MTTTDTELIAGAAKQLRHAITPLIHEKPHWNGYQALRAEPLYNRMRHAATTATTPTGAPVQASKAPARIDVLAWFCDIDATVAEWPGPPGTTTKKLDHYHNRDWTPDEIRFVKAATRRCQHWVDQAQQLLGDNPPSVPLRQRCPICEQLWTYTDDTRQYAIKATATMDAWHVTCAACKTVWYTEAERALLLRMLRENTPKAR